MDSLPQEIVDEIIDNLPTSSLRSSSLVAKQWRKRSQRRTFRKIPFSSESKVNRWHIDVQSNPDGISSYVQFARFCDIRWDDPALFGRVLESFSSLTTLWTFGAEIPEETPEQISHGELGRRVTALYLRSPRCSLSTVISMSLSLLNLQKLWVDDYGTMLREGLPAYPVPPQRGPLDLLNLSGLVDEVAEAFANLRFTSLRLSLDFRVRNARDLLSLSSAIVQELMLIDDPDRPPSHLMTDLPPLPVLTSLRIFIFQGTPSPQLIDVLSSISSVPALASISIEPPVWSSLGSHPSTTWEDLDRWLVRTAKNVTVEGGLVLTLMRWPYQYPAEVLFPKFREAGKIRTDREAFNVY